MLMIDEMQSTINKNNELQSRPKLLEHFADFLSHLRSKFDYTTSDQPFLPINQHCFWGGG